MSKLSKFFFIFLLKINIISSEKPLKTKLKNAEILSPGYKSLFDWGFNNSLNITKDLKFTKKNKFIAKEFISIDDIVMDIPPSIMLNVNTSLQLLNSSKLKKQYKLYIEQDKLNQEKKQAIEDDAHVDQSFLAYILYIVQHKKKKFEKTEFYNYYKNIFYMFEGNIEHLPFFYSSEQIRLFSNTTFGGVFENLNRYFSDEYSLFEKNFYKKHMIFEDYLKYRIFSVQKYYNLTENGGVNLVPFIDLIKQSHNEPNCIFYEEKGHIKVRAILNLFPGDELIIKPENISNQHRLIFFGETFDEIIDVFPSYSIPVVAKNFLLEENLELDNNLLEKIKKYNMMDLCVDEFYNYVIDLYSEIAVKINKKHKGEIHALKLLIKYLKKLKSNIELIDDEKIRNSFFSKIDIDNARRILKGEKMFLGKKIGEVQDYIKKFRKIKKIMDKSNNGNIDIEDL